MTKNIANACVGIKAARKMNANMAKNKAKRITILTAIMARNTAS